MTRTPVSRRLPDFPWDQLLPYAATARAHPDGVVDLSIGTPVDPTPDVVQQALRAAADSPGYPVTIGRPETRQACIDWAQFREAQREPARLAVASALVLDAIARRERLDVRPEEIDNEIERFAERAGRTPAALLA